MAYTEAPLLAALSPFRADLGGVADRDAARPLDTVSRPVGVHTPSRVYGESA